MKSATILSALLIFTCGLPVTVKGEGALSALKGGASYRNTAKTSAAKKVRMCNGGRFAPCVCWQDVPRSIQYRPTDERCFLSSYPGDQQNYVASIQLTGEFKNIFSVVVRDVENADRSPYEPKLCTREEFEAGERECSRWKVQLIKETAKSSLHCLGASGFSKVFKRIRRMTIKVTDTVDETGQKDIRRFCLKGPAKTLNVTGAEASPTPAA